jgi:hypothetical protein
MHARWILLCMSLILLSYASLINKEGIGMRMKSKGGLAGSIPRPVAGWVCYSLVSELLVETPGRYGSGLLVRVSWSRSNSDREVENLRRNGIAEATQETKCHRSSVGVRRIVTVPFEFGSDRHCRIRRDLGSLDRRTGESGPPDPEVSAWDLTLWKCTG